MATPICPKCGRSSFEMQPTPISNMRVAHLAINCSSCGAVVTFVEHRDVGGMILKIMAKLGIRWP